MINQKFKFRIPAKIVQPYWKFVSFSIYVVCRPLVPDLANGMKNDPYKLTF